MLKVCVVAQRIPFPPNKGEKLRTYHQIEYLVKLGYNVEVLSLIETNSDQRYADELASSLGVSVRTFQLSNKLLRYGWAFLKRLPISVGAFRNKSLQEAVDKRLAGGCDVLLLTASSLSYYALSSSYFGASKCTCLMDFMDVDSDKWRQYAETASFPMNWVYARESAGIRALEAKTNQSFATCFLIAEEESKLFHKKVDSTQEVKVLGNGLDFDAFYPATDKQQAQQDNPTFLFTGVMDYKPNVDAVLWFVKECWPSIRQRYSAAEFIIAGMSPTDDIKALDGTMGVKVTGFVEDILPYFHKADVFVAPFRLARGVQNKVLQAAACALPIVTTSMGAEGIHFAGQETMWIEDEASKFTEACVNAFVESNGDSEIQNSKKADLAYRAIKAEYSWEQKLVPLRDVLSKI